MNMKKSLRRAALVVAATALPFMTMAAPAHAANLGHTISRGTYVNKGDYLSRTMSGYSVQLIMQQDGNLVLKATTGRICWASNTVGGHRAVYQSDGNFVVYNSSGKAMWASNTVGATWETGQTVNINASGTLYVGYKKISACSW